MSEMTDKERRSDEALANIAAVIKAMTGKTVEFVEMDLSQDGELTPVKEEGE